MAKLYFQNGKIISRSGNLGTAEGCCCGGAPDCLGTCHGWNTSGYYTVTVDSNLGNYTLQGFGDIWYSLELGITVFFVCSTYVPCGEVEEDVGAYAEIYFGFYPNFIYGRAIIGRAKEPNCNTVGNLNNKTFNIFSCDGGVSGSLHFAIV